MAPFAVTSPSVLNTRSTHKVEGRLEEALYHFRAAFRLAPGDAEAANYVGVSLARLDEGGAVTVECRSLPAIGIPCMKQSGMRRTDSTAPSA
jgi:hypothetical protein